MSTLREDIQAKIATAESAIASWKNDLALLEQHAQTALSQDIETIKTWIANLTKHLGL
jgi:hypothetical protein